MTVVSTNTVSDWYSADGVNKLWAFGFTLFGEDMVTMEVTPDPFADTIVITEFSSDIELIPYNEEYGSGTIIFPVAAAAIALGYYVRIKRTTPLTQTTKIGVEGDFSPKIHEKALDKLTLITQDLSARLAKAEELISNYELDINNIFNITRYRRYDVTNYGADPDRSAAINTNAIQQAINDAYTEGGGDIYIPFKSSGLYLTQASLDTTIIGTINAGPVFFSQAASLYCSLLLRDKTYLILDDNVTIENQRSDLSCIALVGMTEGGVSGGHIKSVWDPEAPVGAGHGIVSYCFTDPQDDPMHNIRISHTEISHVASYALGMQMGYMKHNLYDYLYLHDVGADAFDHKARPMKDGSIPINNIGRDILAERYGLRAGVTASCAVDARGPILLENITAREINYQNGKSTTGVRLSAGLHQANLDVRQASAEAILSNFQLDGGDPTITGGVGVTLLDSGAIVENGFIKNMETGVSVGGSSSGWGTNDGAQISNVQVEGARYRSFEILSSRVSVSNCAAFGQVEEFEKTKGNLIADQTNFVSPREFDPATVEVYKDLVKLTSGVDYTIGGTTEINGIAGVLDTTNIKIVSPTPTGYYFAGEYAGYYNCRSVYVINKLSMSILASKTLRREGAVHEDESFMVDYGNTSTVFLQAAGTPDDIEMEVVPKGIQGVTVRSRSRRGVRVLNATGNEVNWLQLGGSEAGEKLTLIAQGADTDIGIKSVPKGTGKYEKVLANLPNYADDAAAAAGGIAIGEEYRNGSIQMIRVT